MNWVKQAKDNIRQAVLVALAGAFAEGVIPPIEPPAFSIDKPKDKAHGDFAVNLAMIMSKQAAMRPRMIAEAIVAKLDSGLGWLEKAEIAGPGFINFFLARDFFHPVLESVQDEDQNYGRSAFGGGRRILIEFVSANPTGLLHMGNGRGAALGDSLANVMSAAGYRVSREFYINDSGNQVEKFGESVEARYFELLGEDTSFPEDGYHGEDIIDTARRIIERDADKWINADSAARRAYMIEAGLREKLAFIRKSLEDFGVVFDVWYSEKSLHESGKVIETVDILRRKGLVYDKDGAVWLDTSAIGDDKDEVLIRSNGYPTYFAADIAYHRDKFARGFDTAINLWGADHHGHVARMKAAVELFGYDPGALEVLLFQFVNLKRGGEIIRMSKRVGHYVTLDELLDEVGKDAARFFFITRSADSQMDFDLDLAKSQSAENPVYYVQYAHARIHSLLKMAFAQSGGDSLSREDADVSLLTHETEIELIREIADLPDEIIQAAIDREPHRLTRYAMDLASMFHSFYTECRCLVDEKPLRQARLLLCDATRIALRNVLTIIGVNAPERM